MLGWANTLAPETEGTTRRALADAALETLERCAPQLHMDRAEAMSVISLTTEDVTEARRIAEDAWRLQRDVPGGNMWFTEAARVRISRCLIVCGLREEAEKMLLPVYDAYVSQLTADHMDTVVCRRLLHDLYASWGRPEDAERYADP